MIRVGADHQHSIERTQVCAIERQHHNPLVAFQRDERRRFQLQIDKCTPFRKRKHMLQRVAILTNCIQQANRLRTCGIRLHCRAHSQRIERCSCRLDPLRQGFPAVRKQLCLTCQTGQQCVLRLCTVQRRGDRSPAARHVRAAQSQFNRHHVRRLVFNIGK